DEDHARDPLEQLAGKRVQRSLDPRGGKSRHLADAGDRQRLFRDEEERVDDVAHLLVGEPPGARLELVEIALLLRLGDLGGRLLSLLLARLRDGLLLRRWPFFGERLPVGLGSAGLAVLRLGRRRSPFGGGAGLGGRRALATAR